MLNRLSRLHNLPATVQRRMSAIIANGIHHTQDSTNTDNPTSTTPTTSRPPSPISADSLSAFTAHLQPVPHRYPPPPSGVSQLIVLGSGSSSGVPRAACILTDTITCRTCALAVQGRPEDNRNWRSNPSLLVHYYQSTTGDYRNVQIDAGKTFRESMLRWYNNTATHTHNPVIHTHHSLTHSLADCSLTVAACTLCWCAGILGTVSTVCTHYSSPTSMPTLHTASTTCVHSKSSMNVPACHSLLPSPSTCHNTPCSPSNTASPISSIVNSPPPLYDVSLNSTGM